MNRVIQQLTDMNNAIKVLQAPPAPPPPSNTNPDSPGALSGARTSAPPPAAVLWGNANNDYSSGKSDVAVGEFTDFLRFYPDDPFAPNAQYYIGQIHFGQMKYDEAVMDFDAVLERYPETKITPDAYFLKGMALKSLGHRDAAGEQFRTVVKKYPKSDRSPQAEEQLRAMGLSAAAVVRKEALTSAGGAARLALRQLPETIVQRPDADTENVGGFGFVIVGLLKNPVDVGFFDLFEGGARSHRK